MNMVILRERIRPTSFYCRAGGVVWTSATGGNATRHVWIYLILELRSSRTASAWRLPNAALRMLNWEPGGRHAILRLSRNASILNSLPVSRYLPILCLALIHALVDAVAMFIEPLWPELRKSLALSERELFLLLSITAIAPNFSQILFGFVQDRYGSRYLLWLGPAAAAVCLSAIGLPGSALSLGVLLAIGYVFIGSFHPEGTVFAGQLLPERRTRAISLFIFGGTLGLSLGPIVSGNLVERFGLGALQWLAVPAVVFVAVVTIISRRAVAA